MNEVVQKRSMQSLNVKYEYIVTLIEEENDAFTLIVEGLMMS